MEVTYVDHMGDDLRVVNSARVSFNKESAMNVQSDEFGQHEWMDEKDEKLINYLASHNHWTPFSHCIITLREKVPIFVARQRFKHMIGFSYNEVSRRYVDEPEFFVPEKVPVALRFDSDLLSAIDAMASRRGMSRNAIISYWCSKGVESE